jgi:hypothetical protein
MRVNDRVDADGKKVLFVEEVQSDWHQAGRKKGYKQKLLTNDERERYNYFKELDNKRPLTENEKLEFQPLAEKIVAEMSGEIPDAPFKTTWHELVLKRTIQLASEGGYDRIAFTTGAQQAARYDLSKQIEFIRYRKDDAGNYRMTVRTPEQDVLMQDKAFSESMLEETFGKELSQKIIKGEGKPNGYGDNLLTGLDLTIGGEGMKGFYDQILPKFLDKYAKKWDAKVGMTEMSVAKGKPADYANLDAFIDWAKSTGHNWSRKEYVDVWERYKNGERVVIVDDWMNSGHGGAEKVQYMDITPKMKESVLTKGQPLFAVGGAGAAMQQEDNK